VASTAAGRIVGRICDQHEGGVAEHPGQPVVVELDAQPALADRQPEPEVDQQRGEPGRRRQPDGEHGGEQDECPGEQHAAELVDRHLCGVGGSAATRSPYGAAPNHRVGRRAGGLACRAASAPDAATRPAQDRLTEA
jgi:hypothetical protein